MRAKTFRAAMHYFIGDDTDTDGLRVRLYLAGGHTMTGIPHVVHDGRFSMTPTDDSGTVFDDDNGDAIVLDIADIAAVRVFNVG